MGKLFARFRWVTSSESFMFPSLISSLEGLDIQGESSHLKLERPCIPPAFTYNPSFPMMNRYVSVLSASLTPSPFVAHITHLEPLRPPVSALSRATNYAQIVWRKGREKHGSRPICSHRLGPFNSIWHLPRWWVLAPLLPTTIRSSQSLLPSDQETSRSFCELLTICLATSR